MSVENNTTLIEGQYFRVTYIRQVVSFEDDGKANIKTLPLVKGLAVEKKVENSDSDHYIVICFIKPRDLDDYIHLEDINFRTVFELDSDNYLMIEEYKNCVEFAINAIKDAKEQR